MRCLIIPFLLISFASVAQYKTYIIGAKGDTLNKVDRNDSKQGKWIVKVPGLRGEPGYDEEGIYRDGKKEGVWRVYTAQGDVFAVENYRWGNKDGRNFYYNIAGLLREESWKAVNPANPYDTVEVPDPLDPYKVQMKVVKIDGTTVKHGNWKYYDGGLITKRETYFLDKMEDPNARFNDDGTRMVVDSSATKIAKSKPKDKPKEVVQFEKKLGKKGKKVIDGRTY